MRPRLELILAVLVTMIASNDAFCQPEYSFESADDFLAPAATWTAWQDTLDRHQAEREAIHRCLGDEATCTRKLRSLRHILLKGADLRLDQQIRLVNRYINRQRYKDDRVSYRDVAGNHFETLAEFLRTGGDCEDFAVAKYFMLREFGVDAEDMRIVVGKERRSSDHHAMLAIRMGDDVMFLEIDNTVRRSGRLDIERFVYAINELGIWDHER